MHIPTADILEVRLWPVRSGTGPSAHLSGLEPTFSLRRDEGRKVASVRPSCFSTGPLCDRKGPFERLGSYAPMEPDLLATPGG